MDIAKKLKLGLDRVLTGRVAKAPNSPIQGRATSRPIVSSTTRRNSATFEAINQTLIKQEDDHDSSFASPPHGLPTDTDVESPLGAQSMNSCEDQMHEQDGSDVEMSDENAQNDSDEGWDTTKSLSPGNCSDKPIPSIEEDEESEDNEQDEEDEEDTPPPKPRAVPYIHGAAKSKKNVKSLRIGYLNEEPNDEGNDEGGEDEMEYDDLEEALIEESEENLLLAEEDLRDYVKHKLTIEEIETWPKEAARLYKLLYLRGLYPLMSFGWVWDFFGHPMPDGIFTPKGSDDKVLIKGYDSQYRGMRVSVLKNGCTQTDLFLAARAVRDLFRLYSRVRALRQSEQEDANARIGPLIQREINRYLNWAAIDADLCRIGYEIGFVWPVFVLDFSRAHDADRIMRGCRTCVQKYEAKWAALGIEDYPRLITVFAIIQHIVVVLVVDTDNHETQDPMPMTEIDVSELNHWLDSAIAISIPIMLARESLLAYRDSFPVTEKEESDPDL